MTDPYFDGGLAATVRTVNDCLQTLCQLGRDDEAQQLLDDATRGYDDIINDPERSDSWKLQQSAARYVSVMTSLAAKLSAAANKANVELADGKSRVYWA